MPPSRSGPHRIHRVPCSNPESLQRAFLDASELSWIDACTVDYPNLRLELRLTPRGVSTPVLVERLARLQRIAGDREAPR